MEYDEIIWRLEKYGLSHNEAKVYFSLLKLGSAMAGRIAKEGMMDRTSCYDALQKLVKRGLATYAVAANRKLFKPVRPEQLVKLLKEREENIEEIMPQLRGIFEQQTEKYTVTLYKGYKGLRSVFEDIIASAKGKENLVIDSSGMFSERMPYYMPHFRKSIETNKIRIRHIVRKGKKVHPTRTTNLRYFPKTQKNTIITTNIYADKIALILWTDVPEAVMIESKEAADSYRDYFEMLWDLCKK